jgi:hypothetical protein
MSEIAPAASAPVQWITASDSFKYQNYQTGANGCTDTSRCLHAAQVK